MSERVKLVYTDGLIEIIESVEVSVQGNFIRIVKRGHGETNVTLIPSDRLNKAVITHEDEVDPT